MSQIMLSKEVLFNREYLKENYPFVLSFDNIIDYMLWRNPQILVGEREARKGKKRWEEILKIFKNDGWYGEEPDETVFYLGGVYDGGLDEWSYQLLSDSPVKMPFKPKNMWLYTPEKVYTLPITNKSVYVKILRLLVKAVIVKL